MTLAGPARRRFRSAQSDRMGFAWEPEELPDMTVEEAREILRLEVEACRNGTLGNEDTATIVHARLLVGQPAGSA